MPAKHQVGRSGTRAPKPILKVIDKGSTWVDALQGAVEKHRALNLIKVRVHASGKREFYFQ